MGVLLSILLAFQLLLAMEESLLKREVPVQERDTATDAFLQNVHAKAGKNNAGFICDQQFIHSLLRDMVLCNDDVQKNTCYTQKQIRTNFPTNWFFLPPAEKKTRLIT